MESANHGQRNGNSDEIVSFWAEDANLQTQPSRGMTRCCRCCFVCSRFDNSDLKRPSNETLLVSSSMLLIFSFFSMNLIITYILHKLIFDKVRRIRFIYGVYIYTVHSGFYCEIGGDAGRFSGHGRRRINIRFQFICRTGEKRSWCILWWGGAGDWVICR